MNIRKLRNSENFLGWRGVLDLHKSGNKLSLDLHKSGSKLSLDFHNNESPKWNSSLLEFFSRFNRT